MEPKTIVRKAMMAGYYWPSMYMHTLEEVQKGCICQVHASVTHLLKPNMIPVQSSWPFQKWAIDIVGPFPEAPGRGKFLVVAIDYLTKWNEAKPFATMTGQNIKRFIWEQIVCRFGLPKTIVSDNGKQFANNPFKEWC
jgi:hypothetical protein